MDDNARSTPEGHPGEDGVVCAMYLTSLAPPSGSRPDNTREQYLSIAKLAQEWQKTGTGAIWSEAHAARLGLERDRVHEIVGCVAAAGEQLGLAWTAQQDMQRWLASESSGKPMATRAFAEMCSYFALGAANAVANATLRTLLLNSEARSTLTKLRKTKYLPFSDEARDWCSFNGDLVGYLKAGAHAIGNADADHLVLITEQLWQDGRWKTMVHRRGRDYHRWRPQSIEGGVPRNSFWEPVREIGSRLRRYSDSGFQADLDAEHLVVSEVVTNGLLALADAMRAWLTQWPSAMAGVGAQMFKAP